MATALRKLLHDGSNGAAIDPCVEDSIVLRMGFQRSLDEQASGKHCPKQKRD